ncbi:hypothetical protein EVG20_g3370 [Dentipellis fragilis]|uniref:SRR1-like domain-containing protein n=1 Tax=Dentipellis fragilis TaxID=205917 RepID=A0A4Y9Z487_9AGAM|nr:hypothetical protein EVG20_g3370 [Dentipellis fragilis]
MAAAATVAIPTFQYTHSSKPSGSRRKRKNGKHAPTLTPTELYERCSQELASGNWLEDCHQMIQGALDIASVTSPRVFCLGLGCPASSKDARAQLAFLLRTCDVLSIDRSKVSAYDPVFAAEDVNLLTALGVAYLDDNKATWKVPHRLPDPPLHAALRREAVREHPTRELVQGPAAPPLHALQPLQRLPGQVRAQAPDRARGLPALTQILPMQHSITPTSRALPMPDTPRAARSLSSRAIRGLGLGPCSGRFPFLSIGPETAPNSDAGHRYVYAAGVNCLMQTPAAAVLSWGPVEAGRKVGSVLAQRRGRSWGARCPAGFEFSLAVPDGSTDELSDGA